MAITLKDDADARQNLGPSGIIACTVASFAATDYPTGGYPVSTPATTTNAGLSGLSRIRAIIPGRFTGTQAILYNWVYNATTGKIQAIGGAAAAGGPGQEAAANTDFSDSTILFLIYGF